MSKAAKIIEKMHNNPLNWSIDDVKTVAKYFKIDFRQPGTSHVTFRSLKGQKLTIPARKPIKPIYIKQFLAFIDRLGGYL